MTTPSTRPRLAVRCDGGAAIGAGHVARCLPVARAFAQRGWEVCFVGRLDGLPAWLVREDGWVVAGPGTGPAGLDADAFDAALVDLYGVAEEESCALARRLPVATLGESSRCPDAGVLVDYHFDRAGDADGPALLAGPRYAPVDPRFAGAGRIRDEVRRVLITVGGSEPARAHLPAFRALVARVLPSAETVVAGAGGAPVRLLDLVADVDLAITAAGLTSYELACAGVPQVALAIVDNQRRVVDGLRATRLVPTADLSRGEPVEGLEDDLRRLAAASARRDQSARARAAIDGQGAQRIADGLCHRWPRMLSAA